MCRWPGIVVVLVFSLVLPGSKHGLWIPPARPHRNPPLPPARRGPEPRDRAAWVNERRTVADGTSVRTFGQGRTQERV